MRRKCSACHHPEHTQMCYQHTRTGSGSSDWIQCVCVQGVDWVPHVQVKLLHEHAKAPTRAHETDTGWDLYSAEEVWIAPGKTANVNCGVAICTPPGWGYTVRGRSSLNKKGLMVLLGTVDAGYSGVLFALLYNGSDATLCVRTGERVAQVVFERVEQVGLELVSEIKLPPGARGEKGFGSSGR